LPKTNISCIGSEETRRIVDGAPRQKLSLIVKVISSDGHSESLMRKLSKKRTIEMASDSSRGSELQNDVVREETAESVPAKRASFSLDLRTQH